MKILLLILVSSVCIFLADSTLAQKVVRVKGSAQVRLENNMTKEQAREIAEEKAMVNAIESEFGTYVEQDVDIKVEDGKESFNIIGGTRVKGEWVRTTGKPEFKEEVQEVNISGQVELVHWITCNIEGEARESHMKAKLDVLTLRCPQINCQAVKYSNGESFYLYFKSPIRGYLSVFIDEDGDAVRRLFPYMNQSDESATKVEGDRTYILFSKDKELNQFDCNADEIELYTNRSIEYNYLYVVFSPLPYHKPILSDATLLPDGYVLPKAVSVAKFQEWLGDCRAAMPDFQATRIKISISKNL